jgi:hypothetical protein
MAPTPSGKGYWMFAADGGVFTFGDAKFYGSIGGFQAGSPMVAFTPTKTGKGYWLATANGRVWGFGDARHFGDG